MRLTGNKGEWSELYAFLKLLATGRLYAADESVNKIEDTFFPIKKIFRTEYEDCEIEYVVRTEMGDVEIHVHSEKIRSIRQEEIRNMALDIYAGILSGTNRAFEIDGSDTIMDCLACSKIAAPSSDKTDIRMQIHDINTGYQPICGFSIKSELGGAPTLLNASGATNFVYEVDGLAEEDVQRINTIDSDTKILDRIEAICAKGKLKFCHAKNANFASNLMLIDTYMEEIIAYILIDYYRNNAIDCKTLIHRLEDANPLGYPRRGFYEYKFKKFLCSVALGMMPSKEWNGRDEANGGYVIVKEDGEVVAYHLYNRDAFEAYLLNNTKLERGSTTKHGFATIYEENNKLYINLNLQIRFM